MLLTLHAHYYTCRASSNQEELLLWRSWGGQHDSNWGGILLVCHPHLTLNTYLDLQGGRLNWVLAMTYTLACMWVKLRTCIEWNGEIQMQISLLCTLGSRETTSVWPASLRRKEPSPILWRRLNKPFLTTVRLYVFAWRCRVWKIKLCAYNYNYLRKQVYPKSTFPGYTTISQVGYYKHLFLLQLRFLMRLPKPSLQILLLFRLEKLSFPCLWKFSVGVITPMPLTRQY